VIRRNQRYDSETAEVVSRTLGPDSIAVDVGAHQGSVLRLIQRTAPRARHYAFEPLPHLAADLRLKFSQCQVFECALADTTGVASFNHVCNAPAYSGLQRREYDRPDAIIEQIQVAVRRLDDIIPEHDVVAFIKLDIEGGEYHALRGGATTIRRCRPVIVFEAGRSSTGCYGVTPEMVFDLVTGDLGLALSTMARWLRGKPPFMRAEFLAGYRRDFYFIAYPAEYVVP
jgi:FkbM family methyltransferase